MKGAFPLPNSWFYFNLQKPKRRRMSIEDELFMGVVKRVAKKHNVDIQLSEHDFTYDGEDEDMENFELELAELFGLEA